MQCLSSLNLAPATQDTERREQEVVPGQISEDEPEDYPADTEYSESSAPVLTSSQYTRYMRSLIKLLVGETTLNEWIRKGYRHFIN